MALIDAVLTTIAQAKETAGVPSGNVSDDSSFERLINTVSSQVARYCDRIFGRVTGIPTYTELVSPPNRQLLILRQWPIVEVTSVEDNGSPLVIDDDFRCDTQDAAKGMLYKENGWMGSALVTGLTLDPVAMARQLTVIYKAGYLLPGDPAYVAGDDGSLPLEISDVVNQLIAIRYYRQKRKNYGLSSMKEGGVSYGYKGEETLLDGSDEYSLTLNRFRRWI